MDRFLAKLDTLPAGYSEGHYEGQRYGITLSASADGRRRWLYGEELGGTGRVSANLYRLADGRVALRPCEMPEAWVMGFVIGFVPDGTGR
ncbi:hypothetical protein [Roseomonas haemaphysalidis]|uniref:hypothetical protein n=1 Tax=Roseomonas haemaphysalidis TaxID=2768162 RepID=UPI001A96B8E2|nr:hypothetical protein [Roseomonas haemaphysalidis]